MALQGLAPYLRGAATDRRNFQAPVSFRILPRILGQAHQALEQTAVTAGWPLSSNTDNPTHLALTTTGVSASQHPNGRVLHTGSFHNAGAYTPMDALAGASADLVLIADRLTAKTLDGEVSGPPHGLRDDATDDVVCYLPGTLLAFGEQARRAAELSPGER